MKKENTKKPLANLKKSYRKLSVVQKMILFIGLMFIVISTLPAVMVLLIGLLPTFTIHNAFFIVGDIFNLIIMLGSAGLGLVAYYEIPNLFIFLSKASAQKRLKNIDAKLTHLAEDWGTELIDRQKD